MWLDHPSIIIVYGERGSGKSATAHYILETRFHGKDIPCYMVGPSTLKPIIKSKGEEPNEWLTVIGRQIPLKSAVLIDDAQLLAHARESWKNIKLDKIISMSRHRESTLIFSTQMAGRIDKNIVASADTNIFKQPPLMGVYLERAELRKLMEAITTEYDKLQAKEADADMRTYSYVLSNRPRYKGFVGPTPLPSYWSDELSRW